MFKRLLGTAIATAAAALGVKVVRDILQADEEEASWVLWQVWSFNDSTERSSSGSNLSEELQRSLH